MILIGEIYDEVMTLANSTTRNFTGISTGTPTTVASAARAPPISITTPRAFGCARADKAMTAAQVPLF